MEGQKLVGIFQSEEEAIKSIKNLKKIGYEDDEISVIAKKQRDLDKINKATDVDSGASDDTVEVVGGDAVDDEDTNTKVMGGAATGGVVGGAGALLLELGAFTIPGVGPILAAGPIAATITGLLAGGAVGSAAGAMVEAGIDEYDAKEYETYLDRGDILIAVDKKDDIEPERVLVSYYDNNSIIRNKYDLNRSNFER